MQAIKDKLTDISAMRKAKAEAKEEEKAQKDLAKARIEVAHEVRLAREAEAAMDLHVNKAAETAVKHEAKFVNAEQRPENHQGDPYGRSTSNIDHPTDQMVADTTQDRPRSLGPNTSTPMGTSYPTNNLI